MLLKKRIRFPLLSDHPTSATKSFDRAALVALVMGTTILRVICHTRLPTQPIAPQPAFGLPNST